MILGVGTDIVSVARIAKAMERPEFLTRVLTADELQLDLTPMRVASRWAAKEAIYKALGGGLTWQDVSILNDTRRAPVLVWHRKPEALGNGVIHLSLSHEHEHAVAFAIWEGRE